MGSEMCIRDSGSGEHLRIRDSGQVQFISGTFTDNVDCIMANGGTMEIGAQSTMKFRTGTNERLRIDSDGRCIVGGGSHAGGSALVVKGGNQNTYSTIGMFSNHTNPSDDTLLSQIRFGSNTSAVGADIRVYADADWGTNDYPTRLSFYTTPDSSNSRQERLRITSDGTAQFSGTGGSAVNSAINRQVFEIGSLGGVLPVSYTHLTLPTNGEV